MKDQYQWWQKAVFYHIYPRSFSDSMNNGIGDLRGIINRLDYLEKLGIDGIWISPFFPSPQKDFGYDVSDYGSIHPDYGTMSDFDGLLEEAHKRGIRILLDLVLNHTSDQHPWFQESKSSRDNDKHDWYVWVDGKGKNGRRKPNNWRAIVGGSVWKWCEEREQYYLHQFLPYQPDLNWWNPKVQEAMFDYIRFWLDKGVDGFRLDIIHTLFEDKKLRNNPPSRHLFPAPEHVKYLFQNPKYTQFLPETMEIMKKLRKIADSYTPQRVLVGEAVGNSQIIKPLYGENNDRLHLSFNFKFAGTKFLAKKFYDILDEMERILPPPYCPCLVYSNHDNPRLISRLDEDHNKVKLQVLIKLTARGTPFIYYGEEIGMAQLKIKQEDYQDPIANHKIWGIPIGKLFGRDGCRTPMQWNNSKINAGFSKDPKIKPWLPVDPNNKDKNVKTQDEDNKSLLNYYRELLKIRKQEEILQLGNLELLSKLNSELLVYERSLPGKERIFVALNFSKEKINIANPYSKCKRIFSTKHYRVDDKINRDVLLEPLEGVIIKELKEQTNRKN